MKRYQDSESEDEPLFSKPIIDNNAKPKVLNHNSNPRTVKIWKSDFETYFLLSTIGNLRTEQQLGYFCACLDSELKNAIHDLQTPYESKLPIYREKNDDLSLMDLLDGYFQANYPLHIRRADLANLRKTTNQKNSEFAAIYLQACTAANMLGRKSDSTCTNCTSLYKINAANCAALLDDRNLRQQLLQDPELNVENIVAKIKNYEAATKTAEKGSTGSANSIQSSKNKGTGGCGACTLKGHKKETCAWRNKTCDLCSKKGHSPAACTKLKDMKKTSEASDKSEKSKGNNSNWKGKQKKGNTNMVAGASTEQTEQETEAAPKVNSVNRHKPTPQTMM